MRTVICRACAVLLLAHVLHPSQAAAQTALTCGQTATGTIAASAERDQFAFNAAAGDVVTFSLIENGDLDAGFLAVGLVLRPDGFTHGTFIQGSVNATRLTATGTYTVVIHDQIDLRRGHYALRIGWALPVGKQCGDHATIGCGQVVSGGIDEPLEQDLFSFAGERDSVVTLPLLQTADVSQGFTASALILRPDGFPVTGFGTNFVTSVTLPESGTYVVIVHDSLDRDRGRFSLRLESPAACPSAPPFLGVGPNLTGPTLFLTAMLRAGGVPGPVDAYIAVQLPTGQFLSVLPGQQLVPGIVPFARGFVPFDSGSQYQALLATYRFTGGEPAGTYVWYAVLTRPGTLDFVSPLHQAMFTVP